MWFQSLDSDLQTRLFVDWMMSMESFGDSKKKKQEAQRAKINEWRQNG